MGNKNVRMSFDAWKQLRNLKFDTGKGSYTEVFLMIFDALNSGKSNIEEVIITKAPTDSGDSGNVSREDKTIVIDEQIHSKLLSYKTLYMREHDITSRGPGSASISQIIMKLISKYREIAM